MPGRAIVPRTEACPAAAALPILKAATQLLHHWYGARAVRVPYEYGRRVAAGYVRYA
eukprot:SAG31_NODE_9222_length_1314_cov_1.150617_1_plen_56_part_10